MAVNELENALRNALAKGDASNPEFRQRVYRAAETAMVRSMHARADATEELLASRRQKLEEAIRATEASYAAATVEPQVPPPPVGPPAQGPEEELPEVRGETRDEGAEAPALRAEPRIDGAREFAPGAEIAAEKRGRKASGDAPRQRRRAPFATMLSIVVLLGLVVIGGWWVVTTGAFQTAEQRDTSVPNPPLRLDNEAFEGGRANGSSSAPARVSVQSHEEEWVFLFRPSDPTTLSLEGGATAEIDSDSFGEFARIASPGDTAAIAIDVPPGTLQMLAGKTAQFAIVARSEDDAPTQISVTCDFGEMGDCGRRRFSVTQSDNEFLFSVDLPAASASGSGSLRINTDIEDGGKAVKLASVRVRELAP